jgi:hypothetical protein
MKRKITSVILIFLGLGFLWQTLGGQAACEAKCKEKLKDCIQKANMRSCGTCIDSCTAAYSQCSSKCLRAGN